MDMSYTTGLIFLPSILKLTSFIIAHTLAITSLSFAGDGIESGRFRFKPTLTLSESYSTNIYLESQNETSEYTTTITPAMTFDLAIFPRNYFSLYYRANLFFHADAENFKDDHHLGSLSFNSKTRKGSSIVVGISSEDTAIQPFSRVERSKNYILRKAYAEILLMLGEFTEMGAEYDHVDRNFEETEFEDDEFKRERWDVHLLYKRSPFWPILIQYRYFNQDNSDLGAINADFKSHTLFSGGRWRPAAKFSGALRIGYAWAQFEEPGANDYEGYAIDTNLDYAFSEFTHFSLTAERSLQTPTLSGRESGDFSVTTSVGLTITHKKLERITTRLKVMYQNRNYKEIQNFDSVREDDYYLAGLSIEYGMRNWVSFSIGYRYQENMSDIATQAYDENLIEFGIILSL